jgi:hypothetical protein
MKVVLFSLVDEENDDSRIISSHNTHCLERTALKSALAIDQCGSAWNASIGLTRQFTRARWESGMRSILHQLRCVDLAIDEKEVMWAELLMWEATHQLQRDLIFIWPNRYRSSWFMLHIVTDRVLQRKMREGNCSSIHQDKLDCMKVSVFYLAY